jgi:spore coat polysaccharide biosynthesis protein SpsF
VQARMGSRRLPGKVLREIGGKPLLQYLLERLERCQALDGLLVATSVSSGDDPIASFCEDRGTLCFRGPEEDLAGRFGEAVAAHELDWFVRLSGDSPLLDASLVERALELARHGGDVVTNIFPRTFPPGQSVEAVRAAPFVAALPELRLPIDREHVTPFFYRHPERFAIHNFAAERDYSDISLVVDTAADLARVAAIVERMQGPQWEYGLDQVVALAQGGS